MLHPRSIAIGVMALSAISVGCGKKPKPHPTPPRTAAGAPATAPAVPTPPPESPPTRTRGGVELASALEEAGDARERVFAAADLLARERPAGVKRLIAEKTRAKATVLALLESLNLDELIGALEVLQADGDPTGARAQAADKVFALLDHEVAAVRDAAFETAPLVADGAALAKLLPDLAPDRKVAVVRLLAGWDGASIDDALWPLVAGSDTDLAIEAALAATSPEKRLSDTIASRIRELLAEADDHELRLGLMMLRRLEANAGTPAADRLPAWRKAAIDRALQSKDAALMLEGVRSSRALAVADREPLYEQLVLDPRSAVRAVTAEVLVHHRGKARDTLVAKLLEDAEGEVRMAAAGARARFGSPKDRRAALTPLLHDPNRGVRLAAAMSLADRELITGSVPLLVKQLGRETSQGTKSILGALTQSGDKEALLAVIELIGGEDKNLAVAAHFALKNATGQDFEDDLGAWRGWLEQR